MKVLKMSDVLTRYNITRAGFYRWRRDLNFPASITPKNSNPMWRLIDIETWEKNNMLDNLASI